MVNISDYPQLRLIAWNRRDNELIAEGEALSLYERNWRHVDREQLTGAEQQLIDRLVVEYGNGVFNVELSDSPPYSEDSTRVKQ